MRKLEHNQSMSNPIDNETGYNDTPACECKPCQKCDGEGGHDVNTTYTEAGVPIHHDMPIWFPCSHCNGSGVDFDDCEIHAKETK